jgi:hypothetical protein
MTDIGRSYLRLEKNNGFLLHAQQVWLLKNLMSWKATAIMSHLPYSAMIALVAIQRRKYYLPLLALTCLLLICILRTAIQVCLCNMGRKVY